MRCAVSSIRARCAAAARARCARRESRCVPGGCRCARGTPGRCRAPRREFRARPAGAGARPARRITSVSLRTSLATFSSRKGSSAGSASRNGSAERRSSTVRRLNRRSSRAFSAARARSGFRSGLHGAMKAEHAAEHGMRGDVAEADVLQHVAQLARRIEHLQRLDEVLLAVERRRAAAEQETREPQAEAQVRIVELLDDRVARAAACPNGRSGRPA
jgi:hypothetical protein